MQGREEIMRAERRGRRWRLALRWGPLVLIVAAYGSFKLWQYFRQSRLPPEVVGQPGGVATRLTYGVDVAGPAWSPDGKRIACLAVGRGRFLRLLEMWASRRGDGAAARMVSMLTAQPLVVDRQGKARRWVRPREALFLGAGGPRPGWVAAGGKLVSLGHSRKGRPESGELECDVWTVEVASGKCKNLTGTGDIGSFALSVSPDGQKIAFVRGREEKERLWVLGAEGGGARQVSERRAAGFFDQVAWAPDSRRIAFVSRMPLGEEKSRLDLCVADLETGKTTQVAEDVPKAAWLPDGERLLCWKLKREGSGKARRVTTAVFLVSAGDGNREEVASIPGAVVSFSVAPSGERAFFVSDLDPEIGRLLQERRLPEELRALELGSGKLQRLTDFGGVSLFGGGGFEFLGSPCPPAVSPDGRSVAFVRRSEKDETMSLWRLDLAEGSR
jgi:Tol biopolymer transport system component